MRAVLVAVLMFLCICELYAIPVYTQHYNIQRTGANTQESILTPAAVQSSNFKQLYTLNLEREICGQVLYVPNLKIGTNTVNGIFFWTNANSDGSPVSAYGYNADTGAQLWHMELNKTAQYQTATPVIDPTTNTMYFVTKNYLDINPNDSGYGTQLLHAVDITKGVEQPHSPIDVNAAVKDSQGAGSNGTYVNFRDCHSNSRPGLLLLNGNIYLAYSYNSDQNPYHGWIFSYSYNQNSGFTQNNIFYDTPADDEGGIWQAGKGIMSDGTYIYTSIGNGPYNPSAGQWGMIVAKYSASLQVLDWYLVPDYQGLSNADLDTGNAGPLLVPSSSGFLGYLFLGPTKYTRGHVLDINNMGKWVSTTQDTAHQTILNLGAEYEVPAQPVAWVGPGGQAYIYLWVAGRQVSQYRFNNLTNLMDTTPYKTSTGLSTSGGGLCVSSNGQSGGILWAQGNSIYALNASDVSQPPFWTGSGGLTHFGFPVVTDGQVYFPTGGNPYLQVYGLS